MLFEGGKKTKGVRLDRQGSRHGLLKMRMVPKNCYIRRRGGRGILGDSQIPNTREKEGPKKTAQAKNIYTQNITKSNKLGRKGQKTHARRFGWRVGGGELCEGKGRARGWLGWHNEKKKIKTTKH